MSTALPPIPYRQDLPPAEGYGTIRYKRNLPWKGPPGAILFALTGAITMYGQWHGRRRRAEKMEIDREQVLGKLYIIPFMLVEAEREDYRRNYYSLMREAMIMKDVKGWEAGVTDKPYHAERYVKRNFEI